MGVGIVRDRERGVDKIWKSGGRQYRGSSWKRGGSDPSANYDTTHNYQSIFAKGKDVEIPENLLFVLLWYCSKMFQSEIKVMEILFIIFQTSHFPLTQDVFWTYIKRTDDIQYIFWKSYVRPIYVEWPGGYTYQSFVSQSAITCSKLTIEILEQGAKYVQN